MRDFTEKDTENTLAQHGYQKPPNSSPYSAVKKWVHPKHHHEVTVDRNQFKHVRPNGETSRGHVGTLASFLRQAHPPARMAYEAELDIYNSKEKTAADDSMVEPKITDRFENDKKFATGDYGNATKSYSPGPTYEGTKMESLLKAILTEAKSFDPAKVKLDIKKCDVCGTEGHPASEHLAKALSGKNNLPVTEAKKPVPVFKCKEPGCDITKFEHRHAGDKIYKRGALNNLGRPEAENSLWKEDEAEKCPECHKVHAPTVPCSAKKLLFSTEEEKHVKCVKCKQPFSYTPTTTTEKGLSKHGAGTQNRTVETMRSTCDDCNKKLRKEEVEPVQEAIVSSSFKPEHTCPKCNGPARNSAPSPVKRCAHCDNVWSLPKKNVDEGMKFSRQHDTPEKAEAHKESLVKQGVKAWVNHSHDGTHHTFWMQEDEQKVSQQSIDEAKKKKWDKMAHVRAIARNTIGQVKKGQTITPKKFKKEKYKKNPLEEAADESKHARAARLHDDAAEHAGSEGRVIDRPYKDACDASYRTGHKAIADYISHGTNGRQGGFTPHRHIGGRVAFHQKLAQMHRDADNE